MEYELRITVEKVSISTQEVVKSNTIKVYDIKAPESILKLGLRHAEQRSRLEKVQNSLIAEQAVLIEADPQVCPNENVRTGSSNLGSAPERHLSLFFSF